MATKFNSYKRSNKAEVKREVGIMEHGFIEEMKELQALDRHIEMDWDLGLDFDDQLFAEDVDPYDFSEERLESMMGAC